MVLCNLGPHTAPAAAFSGNGHCTIILPVSLFYLQRTSTRDLFKFICVIVLALLVLASSRVKTKHAAVVENVNPHAIANPVALVMMQSCVACRWRQAYGYCKEDLPEKLLGTLLQGP